MKRNAMSDKGTLTIHVNVKLFTVHLLLSTYLLTVLSVFGSVSTLTEVTLANGSQPANVTVTFHGYRMLR